MVGTSQRDFTVSTQYTEGGFRESRRLNRLYHSGTHSGSVLPGNETWGKSPLGGPIKKRSPLLKHSGSSQRCRGRTSIRDTRVLLSLGTGLSGFRRKSQVQPEMRSQTGDVTFHVVLTHMGWTPGSRRRHPSPTCFEPTHRCVRTCLPGNGTPYLSLPFPSPPHPTPDREGFGR